MMQEIVDALKARWKSPVFGYYIFALIVVNWKGFFFLAFDDGTASVRIDYFDANTSLWSVAFWPLLIALGIAASHPWIQAGLAKISSKPQDFRESLHLEAEHRLLMIKRRLEEERNRLSTAQEEALIERAKRDEILDSMEDTEAKARLKLEIESLRSQLDSERAAASPPVPPAIRFTDLINAANSYRDRAQSSKVFDEQQTLRKRADELEEMAHRIIKVELQRR